MDDTRTFFFLARFAVFQFFGQRYRERNRHPRFSAHFAFFEAPRPRLSRTHRQRPASGPRRTIARIRRGPRTHLEFRAAFFAFTGPGVLRDRVVGHAFTRFTRLTGFTRFTRFAAFAFRPLLAFRPDRTFAFRTSRPPGPRWTSWTLRTGRTGLPFERFQHARLDLLRRRDQVMARRERPTAHRENKSQRGYDVGIGQTTPQN